MRHAVAVLSLALLLAFPGEARPGAGLIRIFAETHSSEYVNVGPSTRSAGDITVYGQILLSRRGETIGYGAVTCTFLGRALPGRTSQCEAFYSLPRGKLVAQGTRQRADYYVLAVIGGTGLYSSATGVLIASTVAHGPRRERLLFSLGS